MTNDFEEPMFREFNVSNLESGNIIKCNKFEVSGKTTISIEEETFNGVKIILKKDDSENIKEIKFVCSCGETKSIVLNYTE